MGYSQNLESERELKGQGAGVRAEVGDVGGKHADAWRSRSCIPFTLWMIESVGRVD